MVLDRLRGLIERGRPPLYECRHCGTTYEEDRMECSTCGATEIACYEF